jgi:hypothetical protein
MELSGALMKRIVGTHGVRPFINIKLNDLEGAIYNGWKKFLRFAIAFFILPS